MVLAKVELENADFSKFLAILTFTDFEGFIKRFH